MHPEALPDRIEALLDRLEAQPSRPFTQDEIDEVRAALTTFRGMVNRFETMGWLGKWILWLLGTAVLVLSQWDALKGRLGW